MTTPIKEITSPFDEITINRAANILSRYWKKFQKDQIHLPFFLQGVSGIGKSSIVRQQVELNNVNLKDVRLSQMADGADVAGIQYVDTKDNKFKLSTPYWFPHEGDGWSESGGILFLDELTNAPLDVAQAAYRIILDRETGAGVKMRKNWMIVAAGNARNHYSGSRDLPAALANRFAISLFIKPDVKSFLEWGTPNDKVHPIIRTLLRQRPELIHTQNSDNKIWFSSPRALKDVSDVLSAYPNLTLEDNSEELADVQHILQKLGNIEKESIGEFIIQFIRYGSKIPDWSRLEDTNYIREESKNLMDKEHAIAYTVMNSIAGVLFSLDRSETRKIENLALVLEHLDSELQSNVCSDLSINVNNPNQSQEERARKQGLQVAFFQHSDAIKTLYQRNEDYKKGNLI